MTPPQLPLVRLEGVGKAYRMGEVTVDVLRDVTLDIQGGELLAIVGPSGSGKTTLLNLIGGLDRPTSGRLWFEGRELTALGPRETTAFRRRAVGFVFQFFNLVSSLTALENVRVATEISDAPLDDAEALRLVGLAERSHHFPAQLSGGEQQRVAIARAFAKRPRLLLCDEPTGALDAETGQEVLRVLWEVCRAMRQTVIVITHNLEIGRMADRVVRLRSGRVVACDVNPHPAAPEEIAW
jgi:putative ABC transport system ATP-binding protein